MKVSEGSLGQRKIDRRLKHMYSPKKLLKHKKAVGSGLDKLKKKRLKDDPKLYDQIRYVTKLSEGSAGLRRLRRLVKKKRSNDLEARLAYKKFHSLNRGASLAKDRSDHHKKFFGGRDKADKAYDVSRKIRGSAVRAQKNLEPLIVPRDDEDFADKLYGRTNRRAKDIRRLDKTARLRKMSRRDGDSSDSFTRLKRDHIDDLKRSKKMDQVSKYPKLP
jgi:hypothetical protein